MDSTSVRRGQISILLRPLDIALNDGHRKSIATDQGDKVLTEPQEPEAQCCGGLDGRCTQECGRKAQKQADDEANMDTAAQGVDNVVRNDDCRTTETRNEDEIPDSKAQVCDGLGKFKSTDPRNRADGFPIIKAVGHGKLQGLPITDVQEVEVPGESVTTEGERFSRGTVSRNGGVRAANRNFGGLPECKTVLKYSCAVITTFFAFALIILICWKLADRSFYIYEYAEYKHEIPVTEQDHDFESEPKESDETASESRKGRAISLWEDDHRHVDVPVLPLSSGTPCQYDRRGKVDRVKRNPGRGRKYNSRNKECQMIDNNLVDDPSNGCQNVDDDQQGLFVKEIPEKNQRRYKWDKEDLNNGPDSKKSNKVIEADDKEKKETFTSQPGAVTEGFQTVEISTDLSPNAHTSVHSTGSVEIISSFIDDAVGAITSDDEQWNLVTNANRFVDQNTEFGTIDIVTKVDPDMSSGDGVTPSYTDRDQNDDTIDINDDTIDINERDPQAVTDTDDPNKETSAMDFDDNSVVTSLPGSKESAGTTTDSNGSANTDKESHDGTSWTVVNRDETQSTRPAVDNETEKSKVDTTENIHNEDDLRNSVTEPFPVKDTTDSVNSDVDGVSIPSDKSTYPEKDDEEIPSTGSTREPEVASTRESEVSSTREPEGISTPEPDVGSTREPEVASTGEKEVVSTGETEVGNKHEPEVTVKGEPDVASIGEPEVANTQEPEVANTREPEVASTGEPEVANTQELEVDSIGEPEVASTGERDVANTREPEVANTREPDVEDGDFGEYQTVSTSTRAPVDFDNQKDLSEKSQEVHSAEDDLWHTVILSDTGEITTSTDNESIFKEADKHQGKHKGEEGLDSDSEVVDASSKDQSNDNSDSDSNDNSDSDSNDNSDSDSNDNSDSDSNDNSDSDSNDIGLDSDSQVVNISSEDQSNGKGDSANKILTEDDLWNAVIPPPRDSGSGGRIVIDWIKPLKGKFWDRLKKGPKHHPQLPWGGHYRHKHEHHSKFPWGQPFRNQLRGPGNHGMKDVKMMFPNRGDLSETAESSDEISPKLNPLSRERAAFRKLYESRGLTRPDFAKFWGQTHPRKLPEHKRGIGFVMMGDKVIGIHDPNADDYSRRQA